MTPVRVKRGAFLLEKLKPLRIVLFQDARELLSPVLDVVSAWDLPFGLHTVFQEVISLVPGGSAEVLKPGQSFKPDDHEVLLLNSLLLAPDPWTKDKLREIAEGGREGEAGFVEGRRLVFALLTPEVARAVAPFIVSWMNEQRVGAVGQRVMPLRTTHTVYDELYRRQQPKVLVGSPWEYVDLAVKASGKEGGWSAVQDGVSLQDVDLRSSVVMAPSLLRSASLDGSFVGPHSVVEGTGRRVEVKGYLGGFNTVRADVHGHVRVRAGSSVLQELQKDLSALVCWPEGPDPEELAQKAYRVTGGSDWDEKVNELREIASGPRKM